MINKVLDGNCQIIIIGQQPWDIEIGSNAKNLAIEFSKRFPVLYINSPLDRFTSWRDSDSVAVKKRKEFIKSGQIGLTKIQDNLWNLYPDCMIESINWIGSSALFNVANRFNNKKFAGSISKALDTLGFSNYILFNDNEMFKGFYLNRFLNPKLSIYYSRDNMVGVPYWRRHGLKFEPQIIANYDLCVTNSSYLMNYCRMFNENSFNVGQGCDLSLFSENLMHPTHIEQHTGIIIGYVGALSSNRLDLNLIEYIAINRPNWTIVLVGPEDDTFKCSRLHSFKNIKFTGLKPMDNLAAYIKSFTVCINPQLLNEITIGNYPRKIDEYLVMGKPVVAVATEAMAPFKDFVFLAENYENYLKKIEEAIMKDNKSLQQGRKEFALSHTWENSVLKIYEAINNTYNKYKS